MPKIPRDISGQELAKLLEKYGYIKTRQTGSHVRLENFSISHKITIPFHSSIKIGTLDNIIKELSIVLNIPKKDLIENLFDK